MAKNGKAGFSLRFWRRDLAVDLGTTSVLIYMPRRGIVLQEPAVLAMRNGSILAAGQKAHRMIGRTPGSVRVIRPLRGGVIADFDAARKLLDHFIARILRRYPFLKLRLIITVPYGTTQVERRAVLSAGRRMGIRESYLIEEPVAAAIGSGLPVAEPRGSLIINLGGGVTEIAVISLGGVVMARTLRQGGETLDAVIQRHLYRQYRMEIGPATAEAAKKQAAYAVDPPPDMSYVFRGISVSRRAPDTLEVKASEITEAINPVLAAMSGAARDLFEKIPPQLASDVMQDGVTLVGGGALLPNLDRYLAGELNLPVRTVENPFSCAVEGASRALQYIERLELQHG